MINQNKLQKILLSMIVIYVFGNVLVGIIGTKAAIVLPFIVISLGIFIFLHGIVRFGIKNLLILIGIGMATSLFYESLSIATGFPYSSYHYTEILGPKILGFPIIVMIAYGVGGYTFWTVAEILTGKFNKKIEGANLIFIPLIAAALMTSWDFLADPILSSIHGAYVWENAGSYFGIPFTNFLGWYLATYTIFQIFSVIIFHRSLKENNPILKSKVYWYQPIIMYSAVFLQFPMLMIFGENKVITIASSQILKTGDIYQSMLVIGIASILVPTLIAFSVVYNSKLNSK